MTLSQTEVEILFPSPLIDIPGILQENLKNRNETCLRNSLNFLAGLTSMWSAAVCKSLKSKSSYLKREQTNNQLI